MGLKANARSTRKEDAWVGQQMCLGQLTNLQALHTYRGGCVGQERGTNFCPKFYLSAGLDFRIASPQHHMNQFLKIKICIFPSVWETLTHTSELISFNPLSPCMNLDEWVKRLVCVISPGPHLVLDDFLNIAGN